MKKFKTVCLFIFFAVMGLILSGCGLLSSPTPTPTVTSLPTATNTPIPTSTPSPTPVPPTSTFTPESTATHTETPTPVPTETSTPEPTNDADQVDLDELFFMDDVRINVEGGYSVQKPNLYGVESDGPFTFIADKDFSVSMIVFGSPNYTDGGAAEEIAEDFISISFERADGEYEIESTESILIDGHEGLYYELSGTLLEEEVRGNAFVALTDSNQLVFGLGTIRKSGVEPSIWEATAPETFRAIAESIKFLTGDEAVESGTTSCEISSDPTYGLTEENPVQVGGGAFNGPSRSRAYFDHLRGPNGEELTYSRVGSNPTENGIVDIYRIEGAGEEVTIYIDGYTFSDLFAPANFTCMGPFPIAEP